MNPDSKMTVSELMRVHPSAMDVFIKRKMLCIGCPSESFHTLEDVARIYGIALDRLLNDLRITDRMDRNLITANTIMYCKQWDATVRFYRDGLRLPVLFSADWFVEFGLTETARLSIADEKHTSVKSCGNTGITITLQVRDIDTAREFASNMGLNPTEIRTHPWNARVFHLFDPEGHRIEMWESRFPIRHRDQV